MKIHTLLRYVVAVFFVSAGVAQSEEEKSETKCHSVQAQDQSVEVCFVLDTTGSMGGLIAGAKRKIWTIANEIAESQPKNLRLGLVAYRDRGDEYITKVTQLTHDLDEINVKLTELSAGGGGDGPESVNQALYEAIETMNWTGGKKVKRLVFLVGDMPPHMDYENDVRYPALCEIAKRKEIRINTMLCGNHSETQKIWTKIAQSSSGAFAHIPQDGGAIALKTPHDEEINRLSIKLNATAIAYGNRLQRDNLSKKSAANAMAPAESQAERACYAARNFGDKVISGSDDFVAEWHLGNIAIEEVKKEQLPEKLKKLSSVEFEALVKEKSAQRKKLQTALKIQVAKREEFLKNLKKKAPVDAFDIQVADILKKQLK